MQAPASGVTSPSKESSTGYKYQCDECDVVIFVERDPIARRADALIGNHYLHNHPELANARGGLDGATRVGYGAPDWGTEGGESE